MLYSLTKSNITAYVELDQVSPTIYKVRSTGLLIDPAINDVDIREADILDLNDASLMDSKYGEVLLYAIRVR